MYCIVTRTTAFSGTSMDFPTYGEALTYARTHRVLYVYNSEQADEDCDGLAENERDELYSACPRNVNVST